MKKSVKWLLLSFALTATLGVFASCGGGDNGTESGSSQPASSSQVNESLENSSEEESSSYVEEEKELTAVDVINARANAVQSTQQNYDFNLNFTGVVELLGREGAIEADYQGKYRYNSDTNELKFKRVTSGLLLYDSTEYLYTKNDQKIKVVMNEDGEVKKTEVVPAQNEELTLVNKPLIALIDNLQANNIVDIAETSVDGYEYEAKLCLSSENPYLAKICGVLGSLGTQVSLKGVTFDNPASGIVMYFNMDGDELVDFKISTTVSFPVKFVDVALTLSYEQKRASDGVEIPSISGLIVEDSQIENELNKINGAVTALKNENDYSLDIFAENEFDPAWNIFATVDSYKGRLYKNTVEENVWFNHSYKYKTHHEEDGAEAYEYAIGNIEDGTVYCASYKGDNTYTVVEDITVDTQFDYMVAPIYQKAENIDCIKKVEKDEKVTYTLYVNKAGMLAMQNTILEMINSNTAEGVLDVENYFNEEYMIEEAEIVVVMENGAVTKVDCLTELRYAPTGGEYTEYNILLTNKIEFLINDKLSKAQDYEAPGKADGLIDNLESIL
ncbi:MAG: hypothetical protein IJV83_00625 [Clostridia bacterium]|nr:hypothetical protein [Clostridia bacterium]